jgi:hypothetical protein
VDFVSKGTISDNLGAIVGGAGPVGGPGGYGVIFAGGGYMRNSGLVRGGAAGGDGGASNEFDEGGRGVVFSEVGDLVNYTSPGHYSARIYGGAGGRGAYGVSGGVAGGFGGGAVYLLRGGYADNYLGVITGGVGGAGGGTGASGQGGLGSVGGDGVYLNGPGTVVNSGAITGGAGGAGGSASGSHALAGDGGTGGNGVRLNGGAGLGVELTNFSTIRGGAGGAAGSGGATPSASGQGGMGAYVAFGEVFNYGSIIGGLGGAGANYGGPGDGVSAFGATSIANGSTADTHAFIGAGSTAANGCGVSALPGSAVVVTNFGTISGNVAVHFYDQGTSATNSDTLVVEAGCAFVGAVEGGGGTLLLASGVGTIGAFIGGSYGIDVSGSMAPTTFGGFGTLDIGAGASFTLAEGSELGALKSTASIAQGGTLSVANGVTVTAQGTLTNNGLIGLDATTAPTWLEITGKLVLQGTGNLVMSDHSGAGFDNAIIGAARSSSLENDSDISGTGYIGRQGQDGLALVNARSGTIDATGTGALILDASSGKGVNNQGLIEATGVGGVIIQYGTVANAAGTILAAAGSTVTLLVADIAGGALQSAGSGQFIASAGADTLDGTAKAIKDAADISLANGATLTIEGAIANSGAIALNGGSSNTDLVVGAAGVTLSGHGSIVLGGQATDRVRGASAASLLDNTGDTISGAGLLGTGQLTLVNAAGGAIIGSSASAILTIDTGANTITNAGLIESAGKETLIASALANTGTLAADGGTLIVEGAVTGAGVATIGGGTLDLVSTFSETVTFGGASGVLELGHSQSYSGSIAGFSKTGSTSLDLADIGFVSSAEATFSGTNTGGVLTVTDGTHTAHISLIGNYAKSTFTASSDGHGGTIVVDPTAKDEAAMSASPPSSHALVAAMAAMGPRSGEGWTRPSNDLGTSAFNPHLLAPRADLE